MTKTSPSMTPECIESFVNDYLKEDLKELEKHLQMRNEEMMEFVQLKNTVQVMRDDLAAGFKTQMNIGGNIFMEAKIDDTEKILVDVGKSVFVELTLEEAIRFAELKIRILTKETDVIREESIKKRADIQLALMCLGEKTGLHA